MIRYAVMCQGLLELVQVGLRPKQNGDVAEVRIARDAKMLPTVGDLSTSGPEDLHLLLVHDILDPSGYELRFGTTSVRKEQ